MNVSFVLCMCICSHISTTIVQFKCIHDDVEAISLREAFSLSIRSFNKHSLIIVQICLNQMYVYMCMCSAVTIIIVSCWFSAIKIALAIDCLEYHRSFVHIANHEIPEKIVNDFIEYRCEFQINTIEKSVDSSFSKLKYTEIHTDTCIYICITDHWRDGYIKFWDKCWLTSNESDTAISSPILCFMKS